MINYHAKYLKYKKKYINLTGGTYFLQKIIGKPCEEPQYKLFKEHYAHFSQYLARLNIPLHSTLSNQAKQEAEELEKKTKQEAEELEKKAKQKETELELKLIAEEEKEKEKERVKLKSTLIRGESIKLIDFINVSPNESDEYFYFNDNQENTSLGNFLGIFEEHIVRYNNTFIIIKFQKHHFKLGDQIIDSETLSNLQIYQDNSKK